MLNKFKTLVVGPGPLDSDPPPDPGRPGLVLDMADSTWVAGLIPGAETPRFPYARPEFLLLTSEDEVFVSGDQTTRPVLVPKDPQRMPLFAGYAETINAGKTSQNEDQACAKLLQITSARSLEPINGRRSCNSTSSADQGPSPVESNDSGKTEEAKEVKADDAGHERHLSDDDVLLAVTLEEREPCLTGNEVFREEAVIMGVFDGHAGVGAALVSANCLHEHIKAKLSNVLDFIVQLDRQEVLLGYAQSAEAAGSTKLESRLAFGTMNGKTLTRDSLVVGALETAFVDMDDQIQEEKMFWKIPGGCAATVALFFMQRLYVANAGDCRALLCFCSGRHEQLSTDFTPDVERKRLQQTAFVYPDFTGKYYSRLEYSRRLTRRDLKKRVLYRDWFMDGWAQKCVKETDLRSPLISDTFKKPRLLNTIGVTRGFGDHHLVTVDHNIPIKPFLTPMPEVKVFDLNEQDLEDLDVLILATDGLWDVLSNDEVAYIVQTTLSTYPEDDITNYTLAAQDLVVRARGQPNDSGTWKVESTGGIASTDDITVFVIPLKYALAPPMPEEDDEMLQ